MAQKFADKGFFLIIPLFLLFLWIAFDSLVATLYILMVLVAFIWRFFDTHVSFPIERRKDNRAMAFFIAVIAYVGFLAITTFIFTLFSTLAPFADFQTIIQLYASSTPILKGSIFLTIVVWGFIIPIIESLLFFGILHEGFITYGKKLTGINISPEKFSIGVFVIFILVSSLFVLFHLQSKSLENIPLLITFIFAFVSCILVFKTKEIKSAILLHMIANVIAVLSTLGWLAAIFGLVGG